MAQPTASHLANLSRLIRTLESKRAPLEQTRATVERLQQKDMVIAGELWMLGEVTKLEAEAERILDALEASETTQKAIGQIEKLEDLLSRPEWDLAEEVLARLRDKESQLAETRRELADQVAAWEHSLNGWEERLTRAKQMRAPVIREERLLWQMRATLEQAEWALRDQQPDLAAAILADLDKGRDSLEQQSERIEQKAEAASIFSRQATMNLLQAPLPDSHYQYAALVNLLGGLSSIEGSSIVLEQDLQLVRDEIRLVTGHLNDRLARQSEERTKLQDAETTLHPAPTAGDAHGAETSEETRHIRPASGGSEKAGLPNPNEQVYHTGDLVARLFVPEHVRSYLRDTPCSVMIATNDLDIPWELMLDQGQFLCLSRPVGRMPTGYAEQAWQPPLYSGDRRLHFLLVYADPANNLPGARQEVEMIEAAVRDRWGDGVQIDLLQGTEASSSAFSRALYRGGYDVIHFAGHAAFNTARPDLSGLLLHDGTTCYAQKLRRLTSGQPLVFLNACETARSADDDKPQRVQRYLQKPIEGLASALLYGGAVGCIGALWPVFDRPAAEFAIAFYNRVLEGYMLGEAVRQARLELKDRYPSQITWAAFVLYGAPTHRLVG